LQAFNIKFSFVQYYYRQLFNNHAQWKHYILSGVSSSG
jgi:hypothetical protein